MKVSELVDIHHSDIEKLSLLGIEDHEDLLEHAGHACERATLIASTGISHSRLLKWVSRADMARIDGICERFALLLEHVGIDTVPELAERTTSELYQKLTAANHRKRLVAALPDESQLSTWIDHALTLQRKIFY